MKQSLVVLLFILTQKTARTEGFQGNPVVLVPGDGGSQFEGKLNKTHVIHRWCYLFTEEWFPLWLNIELLAPGVLGCTVDNLRLVYDYKTRSTHNSEGVQIRVPGFGNTSTVEWLDSSEFSPTSYFYQIAEGIVKKLNYTRNVNIRGAPYDFRKAPNELGDFLKNLGTLIEETYTLNGNKKVILIGHSMGNPVILYLLNHKPQAWKDKYIRSFISMSGPYGGAAKTLRLMASGDNLGVFVVNPLTARPEQRSMPSTAWLLPYDSVWPADEVLIQGPTRNYTTSDYKQFFADIQHDVGYQMRLDTENLIKDLTHPGVEVHCMHGTKVQTPASFRYSESQWPDDQPTVTYGNGDGTVNMRSLLTCMKWKDDKWPFYHLQFDGADHLGILKNEDVIKYIVSVVSGDY